MRPFISVVSLLSLCAGTWALHESDVGVVDWHKKLIGVPLIGSVSTSPSFHRVENKTLIIATTVNNVLAALEPEDGSVSWRYIFNPEDRIVGYYKNHSVIATLSGPGGSTLRTFNASDGQIIMEKRLHTPTSGALSEPPHFGKHVIFSPDSDILYVLSNGCTVSAVDAKTGEFKWRWTSPDQGSLVIHSRLAVVGGTVYAAGVAKSMASYTLHVTSLNSFTGEVVHSANIASSIADPLAEFALVSRPDLPRPVALWLEQGALRYVGLTSSLKEKARPIKGSGFVRIEDVGVSEHGQVVVIRQNGLGVVLKLEGEQTSAKAIWEFENPPHSKEVSESNYAGGIGANGATYIGRIFWSHSLEQASADVHASTGQGTGHVFPFDTKTQGMIGSAAIDSETPSEISIRSRILIVTSTGAVQLWDQDQLKWSREEALSAISVSEMVEIPEKVAAEATGKDALDGFISRLLRQISDAQDFPQYVVNFAKRFATGSYASPTSSAAPKANSSEGLSRDTFGFRQVIVAATTYGKVYGIDSSNGAILWSRLYGLGWAEEVGGRILPVKLYTIKTVADGGDPEVVIVAQRRADNSLVDTVLFHVDVMTGKDVAGLSKEEGTLGGNDIIAGGLVEGYFLNAEKKMVILLDEYLQVYLYPDTPETQAVFNKVAHALSFPLRTTVEGTRRVLGHQISPSKDTFKPVAHPTWSLSLPSGEDIQTIQAPTARGPIASIGKVLGNRTTLYKYLNPRLFVVTTAVQAKAKCGLYVVDSMKGFVVYHVEVKASEALGCDFKFALVDNWLVYHYYEGEVGDGTVGGAKGYRVVSVEFYEGQGIDEKTKSSELSSFSSDALNFHSYEQAYVVPHRISAITSTTTRFGITNKDIIVSTKDKVFYIPRMFLNPRRPHRKPTAEEQEEFLVQYEPIIPNDPRRVLSHNYDVANVQKIITSPALLESTSLVFAYGLDMFLTRIAPSGTFDVLSETFNKVQLVFTVGGLLIAILVTKPMVQKKKLRERWYT